MKPHTFWDDLAAMLDFNPQLAPDDTAIGDQARALVALHRSDDHYRDILDRAAVAAYAGLHDVANYSQVGLDAGNGWRRQPNGGYPPLRRAHIVTQTTGVVLRRGWQDPEHGAALAIHDLPHIGASERVNTRIRPIEHDPRQRLDIRLTSYLRSDATRVVKIRPRGTK